VFDAPLLDAISAASIPIITEVNGAFRAQDLTNTAWAYSHLELQDIPLLPAISAASLALIRDFVPQDLSNPAWSFAKLELEDHPLMEAIAAASLAILSEFCPQSLSTSAWALAKLLWEHTPFLTSISAQALPRCSDFVPPDITSTAWALATLILADPPLRHALSSQSIRSLREFDSVEISLTAWSCARLRWSDHPLRDSISAAALAKLSEFGAQEIGNSAWAVSVLGGKNSELLNALAARFRGVFGAGGSMGFEAVASSDGGGVEWVEVVSAVVTSADEGHRPTSRVALELEAEFACRFFWPVVFCISDLATPHIPHAAAYRALSHMVDKLGLAHLGTVHTRLALPAASSCRPPPQAWVVVARDAVHRALAGRVGAGTTERCIVYAAACFVWRDAFAELPGNVYGSLPRGPPAPIGESPEDRARALLRHVHRHVLRDNHAERAALLAITTAAVRLSGDGGAGAGALLAECAGAARLYGSHVPCVSCVAAAAQFSRCLPAVHLEFEFADAWRESHAGGGARGSGGRGAPGD